MIFFFKKNKNKKFPIGKKEGFHKGFCTVFFEVKKELKSDLKKNSEKGSLQKFGWKKVFKKRVEKGGLKILWKF